MSKSVQLLAAVLFIGICAFAQDSTQPAPPTSPAPQRRQMRGDRTEQRLKRMTKRLTLTDDQQEKLRPILQDEQKQMQAVDDDTTLTPQQKHRKLKEIHRSSRSQMDSILTDDQKKLLGSERPRGDGMHHGRRAPANPGTSTTTDSNNPQ